jgi:hypothetical protein
MPDAPDYREEDGTTAHQVNKDEELSPGVPARHPLLALLQYDVGHVIQHLLTVDF